MDWFGDLPTWVTAVAVIFTASQYLLDRRRHQAELFRESRVQASQLSAWPVSDRASKPLAYGVLISNSSGSTFHDVLLQVVLFGDTDLPEISLKVLPPGDYFVQYSKPTWDFALSKEEYGGFLRPYTQTEKCYVQSMRFVDSHDQAWEVDRHMVLTTRGGSDARAQGKGAATPR